jgi:predicted nucleic acid-binding protein
LNAGYLLDTNVISETRKARADRGVLSFLSKANETELFLSVLTLGELRRGVELKRRTDAAMANLLDAWVESIETHFADRLLSIDTRIARRWSEISARRSLSSIDTLIAATALHHGLILVTRDTRDVESTGVTLMDPWNARTSKTDSPPLQGPEV